MRPRGITILSVTRESLATLGGSGSLDGFGKLVAMLPTWHRAQSGVCIPVVLSKLTPELKDIESACQFNRLPKPLSSYFVDLLEDQMGAGEWIRRQVALYKKYNGEQQIPIPVVLVDDSGEHRKEFDVRLAHAVETENVMNFSSHRFGVITGDCTGLAQELNVKYKKLKHAQSGELVVS